MQSDYDSAVLAYGSSVIAYWKLTESSGTSFADSKSGSYGAASSSSPSRVTGPDGSATGIAVAATSGNVPTVASFPWPESFSVCFWVKPTAAPAGDEMYFEWNQSAFAKYVQFLTGYTGAPSGFSAGTRSLMTVQYGNASGAQSAHHPDSDFGTGAWKFVVVTFDASQGASSGAVKVYVDGSLVSVTTGLVLYDQPDGAPGSGYLGIGGRNNAGTRSLGANGALNGFAVLSGVLTSGQVTSLKSAMLQVPNANSPSVQVHGNGTITKTGTAAQSKSSPSVQVHGNGTTAKAGRKDAKAGTSVTGTSLTLAAGDTMVDTNGVRLNAHTPTGTGASGSWTDDTSASTDTLSIVTFGAGTAAAGTSGASFGSNGFAKHSYTPNSADYDVEIDVTLDTNGLSSDHAWLLHRWSYPTEALSVKVAKDGITVYRNAPSGAQIGSTYSASIIGAHTVRAQVRGNVITVLLDGSQVLQVTDPVGVTGPGKGGIRVGWYNRDNKYAVITAYRLYDFATVTTRTVGVTATAGGATTRTFTANHAAAHTGSSAVTGNGASVATGRKGAQRAVSCDLGRVATSFVVTGVTQSGAPTTLIAASGSPDGLNYNAFPGACLMPNGNLLIAWHHANDHVGSGTNKIYAAVGTPDGSGGYTWGSPATLRTSSGVNLADVGCVTLADGRVMVAWNESTTPGLANSSTVTSYNRVYSSDNAATWGSVQSGPIPGFPSNGAGAAGVYGIAPTSPIVMPNGDLLLLPYGNTIDKSSGEGNEFVKCMKSTDSGATWTQIGTAFPQQSGWVFDETAILRLDNGTLLAASRASIPGSLYEIWCNTSTNDGVTWGTPYRVLGNGTTTGFGGKPDLIQTANGGVLLRTRYMNAAASSWPCYHLSTDRGATFGTQIDPYDGTVGRTGDALSSGRGRDVYGAFAATAAGSNTVGYTWAEDYGSTAAMFFRTLTVTHTGSGALRSQNTVTGVKGAGPSPHAGSGVSASTGGGLVRFGHVKGAKVASTTTGGGSSIYISGSGTIHGAAITCSGGGKNTQAGKKGAQRALVVSGGGTSTTGSSTVTSSYIMAETFGHFVVPGATGRDGNLNMTTTGHILSNDTTATFVERAPAP